MDKRFFLSIYCSKSIGIGIVRKKKTLKKNWVGDYRGYLTSFYLYVHFYIKLIHPRDDVRDAVANHSSKQSKTHGKNLLGKHWGLWRIKEETNWLGHTRKKIQADDIAQSFN